MTNAALAVQSIAVQIQDLRLAIANQILGRDLLPPTRWVVRGIQELTPSAVQDPTLLYGPLFRARGFYNALVRAPLSASAPILPRSLENRSDEFKRQAAEGFFWGALELLRVGEKPASPETIETLTDFKMEIVALLLSGRTLTNQTVPLATGMIQRFDETAAGSLDSPSFAARRTAILRKSISDIDARYLERALMLLEELPTAIEGYQSHSRSLYGDLTPALRDIFRAAKRDLTDGLLACESVHEVQVRLDRIGRALPRMVRSLIDFSETFEWRGPSPFRFTNAQVFPPVIAAAATRAVRSANPHYHQQVIDAFATMLDSMQKAADSDTASRLESHFLARLVLTRAVETGDFDYPERAVRSLPRLTAAIDAAAEAMDDALNADMQKLYLPFIGLYALRTGRLEDPEKFVQAIPKLDASLQWTIGLFAALFLNGDERAFALFASHKVRIAFNAFYSGTLNFPFVLAQSRDTLHALAAYRLGEAGSEEDRETLMSLWRKELLSWSRG